MAKEDVIEIEGTVVDHGNENEVGNISSAHQYHGFNTAVAQTGSQTALIGQVLLHQLRHSEPARQLEKSGSKGQGEGKEKTVVFTEEKEPGLVLHG